MAEALALKSSSPTMMDGQGTSMRGRGWCTLGEVWKKGREHCYIRSGVPMSCLRRALRTWDVCSECQGTLFTVQGRYVVSRWINLTFELRWASVLLHQAIMISLGGFPVQGDGLVVSKRPV